MKDYKDYCRIDLSEKDYEKFNELLEFISYLENIENLENYKDLINYEELFYKIKYILLDFNSNIEFY